MTEQHMMIPTSQIQVGDVVLNHGMRIEIVTPLQQTARSKGSGDLPVYFTRGAVLNAETAARKHGVPLSWMREDAPAGYSHGWTIQGNDRAVWAVVR